jgi:(p)ppGpp synthase/HD superfamily hydrolase
MTTVLEQVEAFARQSHEGQRRKYADEPYIEHPIRVMHTCEDVTNKTAVLAAALLHDVLEDTLVTRSQMQEFLLTIMPAPCANETLKYVIELTDVYTHRAYPQWKRRLRKDKEIERLAAISDCAQTIKYADIIDNAKDITGSGSEFTQKYLTECQKLLRRIPKGDQQLYWQAMNTVERCLANEKVAI